MHPLLESAVQQYFVQGNCAQMGKAVLTVRIAAYDCSVHGFSLVFRWFPV